MIGGVANMIYKEISLTQSKVALVDAEDCEWLNQWKWCANLQHGIFYATRHIYKNGKRKSIYMHREIIKLLDNMFIDHINRNGLDNRKSNLRICNKSQNAMNRERQINNKSGYKGVCWGKQCKKWRAYININKKPTSIGLFKTKEDAALAYNETAIKYHGRFAKLNLIRKNTKNELADSNIK